MFENTGISVVLADDHPAMLENTSELLGSRFNVVARVSDGKSAVEAITRLNPQIAVLDIMMPKLDGIAAARELLRNGSKTKVIFLTIQNDEDYIAAALSAGALGYVLKSRMRKDLPLAIEQALAGNVFVSSHPSFDAMPMLDPFSGIV
jgi:DNA-binding NarL/FixJ family response regulator